MSRISKEVAHTTAQKIVAPLYKESLEAKELLRQFVTNLYENSLPADVMKMFKKHSEFIKTHSNAYVSGVGLKRTHVSMLRCLPAPNGYAPEISLNAADSKQVVQMLNLIDSLKNKADSDLSEIKNTILSLGTYNRVKEKFPEAIPYLPQNTSCVALAISIDPVREKVVSLSKMAAKK